jgi:hypothetical protein
MNKKGSTEGLSKNDEVLLKEVAQGEWICICEVNGRIDFQIIKNSLFPVFSTAYPSLAKFTC